MAFDEKLREYARLTVRQGVNVSEGIYVIVRCPIIAADFGRMVMEEAFRCGAKDVIMQYSDTAAARIRYENAALSQFETVPAWQAEQSNYYAREGTVAISIIAEDPEAFAGVDGEKLLASAKARRAALKEFYDIMDAGNLRWTVVAYPCAAWARKIFPDVTDAQAIRMLWDAIFKSVRITRGDTVKKWEKHDRVLKRRAKKLNSYAFTALEFKTASAPISVSVCRKTTSGSAAVKPRATAMSTSRICRRKKSLPCRTACRLTAPSFLRCRCPIRDV